MKKKILGVALSILLVLGMSMVAHGELGDDTQSATSISLEVFGLEL
ncbi:MAG: hypothetical protein FWD97_04265 [Defluviitaleaceae bacterium]|nr:hypothetical protein [Defluviitaleaceae bacterium]